MKKTNNKLFPITQTALRKRDNLGIESQKYITIEFGGFSI